MTEELEQRVKNIDRELLEPLVRQLLHDEDAVLGEYHCESIEKGAGGRVFRIAGNAQRVNAQEGKGEVPWSLILKIPRQHVGLGDPYGGTREPVFYRSQIAKEMPAGINVPRCFAVLEQPGGEQWIWMEEITDVDSTEWSLERYGAVARQLGRFNGAFLMGHPLPTWPWLQNHDDLRAYVARFSTAREQLSQSLAHWQVQGVLDDATITRFLQLYDNRELFIQALAQLPQTLCHGDADHRNLLWRIGTEDEVNLVVVDWAFVGMGAAGKEPTHLVDGAALFSKMAIEKLPALSAIVFQKYMQGLRDAGWQKEPELARLGYAATSAIEGALVLSAAIFDRMTNQSMHAIYEKFIGAPVNEIMARLTALLHLQLALADEARALIHLQNQPPNTSKGGLHAT